MEAKAKFAEAADLKKFAFFGVAVATVSTLIVVVAVPIFCVHMQSVTSGLSEELMFCKAKNVYVRGEIQQLSVIRETSRQKRQTPQTCCSCGIGETGPAGVPGQEGAPGNDGKAGQPGAPGADADEQGFHYKAP
ncbi:hypothetical protein L3Y34_011090 [Caenorhabditis briggsae]|nr:hypothetical protein L3Y34_011090 [Caenorhabditis briggsae]